MLWAFAFFINLNRVDIIRKIITPRDTAYQYLRSPFLVPDALCLIVATACTISGDFREAHYIKLIRIFHFNEVLFPANLCVQTFTSYGQKRVSQIQQLIFIFFLFVALGHILACFWIYIG